MKKKPTGLPNPTAWLWWVALFFLAAGIVISQLISAFSVSTPQDSLPVERLILAIAIALSGICIISATAGWWIRR